jgi:hypothetical protein
MQPQLIYNFFGKKKKLKDAEGIAPEGRLDNMVETKMYFPFS